MLHPLLGGAITILKNDGVRQWGWHDIPYKKWKIELMFQTTNQSFSNLSDEITKVLYK
jgi:hypothetical protein